MNGADPDGVRIALRELLPAGAGVAVAAIDEVQRMPAASEAVATARMAPRRKQEFAAGRACAEQALAQLGMWSRGVAMGPQREPVWPAGAVGSISHAGNLAAAAAAPATLLAGMGIDIEPALPLDADLIDRVCRPAEVARLGPPPDAGLRAKILFSAKESVYKCLWPARRQFLEFADLEILQVGPDNRFTARGWGPLANQSLTGLHGRFTVAAGLVITAAWIPGPAQTPRRLTPDRRSGPA